MVQFTIAYVALGLGVLLVVAGVLSLQQERTAGMLSATQRLAVLGGLGGMLAFIAVFFIWWR